MKTQTSRPDELKQKDKQSIPSITFEQFINEMIQWRQPPSKPAKADKPQSAQRPKSGSNEK